MPAHEPHVSRKRAIGVCEGEVQQAMCCISDKPGPACHDSSEIESLNINVNPKVKTQSAHVMGRG